MRLSRTMLSMSLCAVAFMGFGGSASAAPGVHLTGQSHSAAESGSHRDAQDPDGTGGWKYRSTQCHYKEVYSVGFSVCDTQYTASGLRKHVIRIAAFDDGGYWNSVVKTSSQTKTDSFTAYQGMENVYEVMGPETDPGNYSIRLDPLPEVGMWGAFPPINWQ